MAFASTAFNFFFGGALKRGPFEKGDTSVLAQFYYADEELNLVASELDSFDGRKDPERCTSLVSQLRRCQDKVLGICNKLMDEAIPGERVNREFRAKFPDDVLTDSLAGELWFGAECLAAGSTIVNREVESVSLRPLAKAVTRSLDHVRCLLKLQCMKLNNSYSERTKEALKVFDRLFADFELSYVSVLVPVKSLNEFHMQQDVTVLMSETLQRALKMDLVTQEMVDNCDPVLMFSIPRLAIVCGLLYYPEGALNIDVHSSEISELFRPFQSLLHKIRNLLRTLSKHELQLLEKDLYSLEEPTQDNSNRLKPLDSEPESEDYISKFYKNNNNCKQFITDFYSYNFGTSPAACAISQQNTSDNAESSLNQQFLNVSPSPTNHILQQLKNCVMDDSILHNDQQSSQLQSAGETCSYSESYNTTSGVCTATNFDENDDNKSICSGDSSYTSVSMLNSSPGASQECVICNDRRQLQRSLSDSSASTSSSENSFPSSRRYSEPVSPSRLRQRHNSTSVRTRVYGLTLEIPLHAPTAHNETPGTSYSNDSIDSIPDELGMHSDGGSSCGTSSIHSDCQDDEEIALAIQAAEIASHHEVRSRFTNSSDLIHRLFVCISGVADQLQTNYASDLRNILKCVFDMNSSESNQGDTSTSVPPTYHSVSENSNLLSSNYNIQSSNVNAQPGDSTVNSEDEFPIENGEDALAEIEKLTEVDGGADELTSKPPVWVPDNESSACMECSAPFTILRRRHHCRNCGKIFCFKCSSNWIPIPHFGHKQPVRVCNACFTIQADKISQQS